MQQLARFLDGFARSFVRSAHVGLASQYVEGLLGDAERKTMEGMVTRLTEPVAYQTFQHFITHSTWAVEPVWERLRSRVPERAGYFVVDDTSVPKQGRHSVGVARQYCGSLGKIANCQVFVSSVLRTKSSTWPLAMELYLPESWCADEGRRVRARIPEHVVHRSKIDVAIHQLDEAIKSGFEVMCVLADAGYGESTEFRRAISERDLCFSVGVSKQVKVFEKPPRFRKDSSASRRVLARGSPRPKSVEEIASAANPDEWERISWRDGTRGPLTADFLMKRVRPSHRWEHGQQHDEVWLICERTLGKDSVRKFYLSNLPAEMAPIEIIRVTHERWVIEMHYRDLKQELALDDFEGRSFPGLARHVVLTAIAYTFLQLERRRSRAAKTPSLSAVRRSVTEIVTATLFLSNERFAKIVADIIRAPPRRH